MIRTEYTMAQSTSHHMHRANRVASVVAIVMCIVMAGVAAACPPQIDFRSVHTLPPAIKFVGGSGTGGSIGGTGRIIAPQLTVTVVDAESAACSHAQRYASMSLLNSSSKPVVLPWDPDGEQAVSAKVGEDQLNFETLSVTLVSKKKPDLFVMRELFGRAALPASQVTLLPGESALLRNIALPHEHDDTLCGQDVVAEVTLSSDRAVKSSKGYLLISQDRWRVRSK
jgi:hypothetical protein